MLYIFNKDEQLQVVLKNEGTACPYYDAVHTEKLSGENTFIFSVPADHPDAAYVIEGNLVAFRDLDQNWQLFEIKQVTDIHGDGLTRTAFCEHAYYELIDDFIEDIRPYDVSAHFALTQVLSGTRWSVGDVADLGLNSTNFYYESALSAVQKVAAAWKGELRFRVVVEGGAISARYVDLLARRGADTGKQFAYGRHMEHIEREVDLTNVATALYGRGKGVEVGEGYGRRLDFADVVWTSPPDPVDKPAGQEWVGDPEALARWGRPGGRHRFGTYDDPEEIDPSKLLQKTWEDLQERKNPRVTYRLDVVDLERLSGYEHEKVRLGDTVRVIDRAFSPALLVEARVVEINRDLLRPENTKITLGNFAPTLADDALKVQETVQVVRDRQGVWDTATPFTGPVPTSWLDGIIDTLQNEVRAGNGSVTLTDDNGILIVDNPAAPTKALRLLGGLLAISNEKDPVTGEWVWRTFGTGDGFTADLLNAGQIRTSLVQILGNSNFYWDGDYLYIVNPENGNQQIRLSKEGIRFTRDGGATWRVAMDFDGIRMEGQSQDGYTHYVGDGVKVYDEQGNLVGHLGSFETPSDQTATFTRNSVAYKQDGSQVAANVPRFEPGKFGQAVMVEEGTENRLADSLDFVTGWESISGASTIVTPGQADPFGGTKAHRIQITGGTSTVKYLTWADTPSVDGLPYALQVWVRVPSGAPPVNVNANMGPSVTVTSADGWKKVQISVTGNGSTYIGLLFVAQNASDNLDFYACFPQIENKAYHTSWTSGTRSAETLTIPTAGVLSPQEGTVELTYQNWTGLGQTGCVLFDARDGSLTAPWFYGMCAYVGTDKKVYVELGQNETTLIRLVSTTILNSLTNYTISWRWSASGVALLINGTIEAQSASVPNMTFPTVARVGDRYDNTAQANGLIDDLRISSRARTDEEILAAYQSGQPLPVDEYTTWKSSFDGHLRNEVPVKKYGLMLKRGTIKLEAPSPDEGIQIYDASNNLRTHIGQYAAGKYGAKVVNGEIYSTSFKTGDESATDYIQLAPGFQPLEVVKSNKTALQIWTYGESGSIIFRDVNVDDIRGMITVYADAYGDGLRLVGRSDAGGYNKDVVVQGAFIRLHAPDIYIGNGSAPGTTVWGDLYVTGNLSAGGSKPARQITQNYGERYLYARESPDVRYVIEGKAQLVNGEYKIDLDPIFLECVEPDSDTTPWLIHLTPMADVHIYVAEIGATYIVVKESTTTSNDAFFWSLSAIRKGYAGVWLEQLKSDEDVLTSNWEDELGVVIDGEPESNMG